MTAPRARPAAAAWAIPAALFIGSSLVLLGVSELALRAAGAFLSRVESRAHGTAGDGKIRVLCLGESTTVARFPFDFSWPRQLQALLDADPGRKYEIVNRGRNAVDTGVIADRLTWLLDAERPQIVVTMMGINDDERGTFRLARREMEAIRLWRVWRWARREIGRAYWLAELRRRARSTPPDEQRRRRTCEEILALKLDVSGLDLCAVDPGKSSRDWPALISSGAALEIEGRSAEAEERFERALRESPGEAPAIHTRIAQSLLNLGEFAGFERHWRAAWAARPWDESLVNMRLWRLFDDGRYEEADALAHETAARFPGKALGHAMLLEIALARRASSSPIPSSPIDPAALREGEAARRLEPGDSHLLYNLARAYAAEGRGDAADAPMGALRRESESGHHGAQLLAARYLANRGRTGEAAETYLRDVAEEDAHRPAVEAFAEMLLSAGRRDEAARLYDLLDEEGDAASGDVLIGSNEMRDETRGNYERVGTILRARGIVWIAMQYPLRPLERLRALTAGFPEAVLVENRRNFLDAGRRVPPPALFGDRFAGDFGHCTRAGNALLAASAAEAVRAAARALAGGDPGRRRASADLPDDTRP